MFASPFHLFKLSTHLLGVENSEDRVSKNAYILTVGTGAMIILRAEVNLLAGDLELTQQQAI